MDLFSLKKCRNGYQLGSIKILILLSSQLVEMISVLLNWLKVIWVLVLNARRILRTG